MKTISILILSILSTTSLFSKNFEGYIYYSYQYLDSSGNDITEKMGVDNSLEQNYYINSSNYKGVNEKGQLLQLYNSNTNTYYYQKGTSIKSFPGSLEYPKEFKFEANVDTMTIEGYFCNSIIVTTESGQTTYFFSDSISIDYENYKNQRFGNWNKYLNATDGALPLKYIVYQKNYTRIATAQKIEFKMLDNEEFNIEKFSTIK